MKTMITNDVFVILMNTLFFMLPNLGLFEENKWTKCWPKQYPITYLEVVFLTRWRISIIKVVNLSRLTTFNIKYWCQMTLFYNYSNIRSIMMYAPNKQFTGIGEITQCHFQTTEKHPIVNRNNIMLLNISNRKLGYYYIFFSKSTWRHQRNYSNLYFHIWT